jgi:superfamily I DNA/RNA helicase
MKFRGEFSHIFVDEYQDINFSQYLLLILLAGCNEISVGAQIPAGMHSDSSPALWVIGDPNQAIYSFRGSDKRFIDRFLLDYPDAVQLELIRSFRCAQPIMDAAARLSGTRLSGTASPVEMYRAEYSSDKSEARGIAQAISRLIGGTGFLDAHENTAAPDDCAVLVRAAPLAEPIIKALNDIGIPYSFTGETPWWEEEPYRAFLAKVRHADVPEHEFQKGKNYPGLSRLFELAEMTGSINPLLDALAFSDSDGIPEKSNEGVHIMTIHAAKGLEFDHVFIPGCEKEILPFTLYGNDRPDFFNEEKRLLYVAMTRARISLVLSWAHKRYFKGRLIQGNASPFLSELESIVPPAEVKKPKEKKSGKNTGQLSLF